MTQPSRVSSPIAGVTLVLVGGDLTATGTAITLAHELRHAQLYITGQPWQHELGLFEMSPGEYSAYDPNGPVNLETNRAEQEAKANYDPFTPQR